MVGVNPGRLLINATRQSDLLEFIDQTAEHHVFNILELQYDKLESHGYLYRKAPRQNWSKRDMVYSYDRSSMAINGPMLQKRSSFQDLIQTAEYGMSTLAADLNNDGYAELLVRNKGGYDSRQSNSQNLKIRIDGRAQVLPAHNNNFPTLTNYDPGSVRLFVNTYNENNWVKIRLVNDKKGQYNPNAIGARVMVNDRYLRVKRAGEGNYAANANVDLHIGLGKGAVEKVEVVWPGAHDDPQVYKVNKVSNQTVTISRTKGVLQ
jgi:hypothetical protein